MNPRKVSRKNGCNDCGANCGSSHKKNCPWLYIKEPDHKFKKATTIEKIKAITTIIKSI